MQTLAYTCAWTSAPMALLAILSQGSAQPLAQTIRLSSCTKIRSTTLVYLDAQSTFTLTLLTTHANPTVAPLILQIGLLRYVSRFARAPLPFMGIPPPIPVSKSATISL